MPGCFQIDLEDNVATALEDAEAAADLKVLGDSPLAVVRTLEPIRAGHKVALRPIAPGEAIVKYGFVIGEATRAIAPGEWVHLHNCRSRYDAGSSELDNETGVRGGTRYA
jgi:altronate dehydratase small subunit